MKTLKSHFEALRNEEHLQFQSEIKTLIEQYDAAKLGIEPQFRQFMEQYTNEVNAINVITKSATSDQLVQVDNERDEIFRGLSDTVKANLNHRNPAKRDAATRLKVLFDFYGNVARKPYNEETTAIVKIVSELNGKYGADSEVIGLKEWIADLESKNNEFDALMKIRFTEGATKLDVAMKSTRVEIDSINREIATMLDALMLVNGSQAYEPFVREYNARVEKYEQTLAMRKGRNAVKAAAINEN